MTERRLHADRRSTRPGGRRWTDRDPDHGTRAKYQKGCDCLPCRAAEATYRSSLRRRHLLGLPILGALVNAVETWRQLRLLTTEYETESALSRRLGLSSRPLQYGTRVRLKTMLKVRRLYQLDILAGLDQSTV